MHQSNSFWRSSAHSAHAPEIGKPLMGLAVSADWRSNSAQAHPTGSVVVGQAFDSVVVIEVCDRSVR
jgi:hypothetical protein